MCNAKAASTTQLSEAKMPEQSESSSNSSSKAKSVVPRPGQDDFNWSFQDEPHAARRKEILAKYPQIKSLYGHDPTLKYVVTFVVALQCCLAYSVQFIDSKLLFFVLAYVVGGTANHCLMMAIHELAHNLGFKKIFANRVFSLFANLPLGIPSAISFKRYHMDHHKYQGEDQVDVDIPSEFEGRFFNTAFTKLIFVILQGFFYAIRPLFTNPKKPGAWEAANFATNISFDLAVLYLWGFKSLLYLIASTFLGMGLHPVAGHFIAEHYIFTQGAETYSYYGILNWVTFNVGYHNEHHDFPFVPGSRLPELHAIAKEYYADLPQHPSWTGVLYRFITEPNITGFSRIKRQRLSQDEMAQLKKQQ